MMMFIGIENIVVVSIGLFMAFILMNMANEVFKYEKAKRTEATLLAISSLFMAISSALNYISKSNKYGPYIEIARNAALITAFITVIYALMEKKSRKTSKTLIRAGGTLLVLNLLLEYENVINLTYSIFFLGLLIPLVRNKVKIFEEPSVFHRTLLAISILNTSAFFFLASRVDLKMAYEIANPTRFLCVFYISLIYTFLRWFIKTSTEIERAISETMLLQELINASIEDSLIFIVNAIEAKDLYTKGHSERVALYSQMLARRIKMRPDQIRMIHEAGLLHDVGKVGVRIDILTKKGTLTKEEFEHIKNHTVWGGEILSTSEDLKRFEPSARNHHERWDGKGYPDGIPASKLPIWVRIITIADAFDAMTTNRPYRASLPVVEAARRIANASGTQFDPDLSREFIHLLSRMEG